MSDLGSPLGAESRDRGLQPYVRVIRARSAVIRAITLAVVAVAVILVYQRGSTYEATAKLLVKPVPATNTALLPLDLLRDTGDPTRTMQTAAGLVDSQPAARRAANRLGGDWTANAVRGATDVEVQGESNVLEVVGRADDPDDAAAVANAFATAALDLRREGLAQKVAIATARIEAQLQRADLPGGAAAAGLRERLAELEGIRGGSDPTIVLAEPAFPPASPTGLPRWLIVALAVLAGFVLAVGAALLLETVDSRVRDEEDVISSFPAPLLAAVPSLGRQDLQAMGRAPLTIPPRVREAYRTLIVQLDQPRGPKNVVMMVSASPRDGRTTSALHLGLVLVEQGRSVILVDLDLRSADLTRRLGVDRTEPVTGADVDHVDELLVPLGSRDLQLLPAPTERDAASADALLSAVPEFLERAAFLAEYVIVDTPALADVSDALRIAPAVNHIVMVARPGNTNKRQLAVAHQLLGRTSAGARGILMVGARRGVRYAEDMTRREPAAFEPWPAQPPSEAPPR